jgi:hypothetical protein
MPALLSAYTLLLIRSGWMRPLTAFQNAFGSPTSLRISLAKGRDGTLDDLWGFQRFPKFYQFIQPLRVI